MSAHRESTGPKDYELSSNYPYTTSLFTMASFDRPNVYNVSVTDRPAPIAPDTPSETEKLLLDFLWSYRVGGEFIYRSARS